MMHGQIIPQKRIEGHKQDHPCDGKQSYPVPAEINDQAHQKKYRQTPQNNPA